MIAKRATLQLLITFTPALLLCSGCSFNETDGKKSPPAKAAGQLASAQPKGELGATALAGLAQGLEDGSVDLAQVLGTLETLLGSANAQSAQSTESQAQSTESQWIPLTEGNVLIGTLTLEPTEPGGGRSWEIGIPLTPLARYGDLGELTTITLKGRSQDGSIVALYASSQTDIALDPESARRLAGSELVVGGSLSATPLEWRHQQEALVVSIQEGRAQWTTKLLPYRSHPQGLSSDARVHVIEDFMNSL